MSDNQPLVVCRGASKTYGRGAAATVALAPTDCEVHAGQRIALTGPSGSGKSTLVFLMAGLDRPTTGAVSWPAIGEADTRGTSLAVIFQGPSLLPPLTVLENVALPLLIDGEAEDEARSRAIDALTTLALADIADKLPEEISGGQAQRAAVARALAGEPRLILADEPTGQLDAENGASVVEVLLAASHRTGAGLLVCTHDPVVASQLTDQWRIESGELTTPERAAA